MESGIPFTIGIQNPSSTDKYWNPVPQWNPESTAWNPESKTVPDSGNRELFACRIRNPRSDFPYGIRNPDFWNPQYNSRNPESTIQLKESGIHWNPVPGIRNPQRGMQNPRLSWILLHGTRET